MPTLTWVAPAAITYGTALGAAQLDASAAVLGTFAYTPAAGIVLGAGQGQILSATFTPTDTTDYSAVTTTATINVGKATPIIIWPNPANITYGMPLGPAQLDASASFGGSVIVGSFTYSPAPGIVLGAGQGQDLAAMFSPQDTADYNSVTANATINVAPATLVITPANATVPYGAPIPTLTGTVAGLQNNDPITAAYLTTAAAGSPVNSYPITASLSDPAGRLGNYKVTLNTGTLTITPDTTSTTLVSSANPSVQGQTVTFTAAVAVTSGASTPSGTVKFLDGAAVLVASIPVSFNANDGRYEASYSTAALAAGPHSITAVYSGDGHEQTSTSGTVSQVVSPAVTGLAVARASGTYGGTTTLTATLTAGSVGVPGQTITFTLNGQPFSGNTAVTDSSGVATLQNVSLAGINAGTYSNSIQASIAGDTNYLSSTGTGTLTVNKANQSIQWSNPADIGYGTALSATQLNATVTGVPGGSAPGALTYTPAAGTILNPGMQQVLKVTAAGTANYNLATFTVHINVLTTSQQANTLIQEVNALVVPLSAGAGPSLEVGADVTADIDDQ